MLWSREKRGLNRIEDSVHICSLPRFVGHFFRVWFEIFWNGGRNISKLWKLPVCSGVIVAYNLCDAIIVGKTDNRKTSRRRKKKRKIGGQSRYVRVMSVDYGAFANKKWLQQIFIFIKKRERKWRTLVSAHPDLKFGWETRQGRENFASSARYYGNLPGNGYVHILLI